MLQHLHIENYAIIDKIDIRFPGALSVITGETGAGKSILMGALNLILGERADSSMLMSNAKKCIVEGSFAVPNDFKLQEYFKENDLDLQDEILLRREISSSGKSRAFVNDTPVSLQQIKHIASSLVDLHQQFDTIDLSDEDMQREVIDAVANNGEHLKNYKAVFEDWKRTNQQLKELEEQKLQFQKEFDFNQFLFSELEESALKENELEEADHELHILSNAESIRTTFGKVYFELKESDQPVTALLKQQLQQMQSFADFDDTINEVIERLRSCQIELDDIATEIQHIADKVQYDEKRIAFLNDRIALGYRLLKKHNVSTTAELLAIKEALDKKLQSVLKTDEHIENLGKKSKQLFSELNAKSEIITQSRRIHIPVISNKINHLLEQVGMPNAAIKIELKKTGFGSFGNDMIEFLFDANNTGRFEALRKVASGGELSRLMLCIKSIVAENIQIPTMIFDEIDSGISGEAAKKVGMLLKGLSKNQQVICITHQPQIAGKGDQHFFVFKEIREGKTKTGVRQLSKEERIQQIAQMLGGENPTQAALENAREMVNA